MDKYPPLDVETDPMVLRLTASDIKRNHALGFGGLPASLPGTLIRLANYIEECRMIDENDAHNVVKLQVNPISPRHMLGVDSDDDT